MLSELDVISEFIIFLFWEEKIAIWFTALISLFTFCIKAESKSLAAWAKNQNISMNSQLEKSEKFHQKKTNLFLVLAGIFITNALLAELIGVKIFSLEKTLGLNPAQISWNKTPPVEYTAKYMSRNSHIFKLQQCLNCSKQLLCKIQCHAENSIYFKTIIDLSRPVLQGPMVVPTSSCTVASYRRTSP